MNGKLVKPKPYKFIFDMYVPLVVVNYLNCDKLGRKKIDVGQNPREH